MRARILIIDDEPMVAMSIGRPLRTEYDVTVVTGPEALQRLLAGEDFDALVCDLIMPGLTGMDLQARLKEHRPELADRMIFLTGGAFTQRAEEFLAQARYWLQKPIDMVTLRRYLQEVTRHPSAKAPNGSSVS